MNRTPLGPDKPPRTTLPINSPPKKTLFRSFFSLKALARWAAVAALGATLGQGLLASGCGASIQGVYEADVRFEHCMALDAQPNVKPAIRQECWAEWLRFYTYGQTRDRVQHARMRIKYLSGEPVAARNEGAVEAVGDPRALAARPGGDGASPGYSTASGQGGHGRVNGASSNTGGLGPEGRNSRGGEAGARRCVQQCQGLRKMCRRDCATAQCEKDCRDNYRRCSRACGG